MDRRKTSVAGAAGALVLAAVVASPAGADTMLAVGPRIALLDNGMRLAVPVRYECPQPTSSAPGQVYVSVIQAVPNKRHGRVPTSSYNVLEARCDGRVQSATLVLQQDHWELPFHAGTALVTSSLDYTDAGGVRRELFLSQELRLSPKPAPGSDAGS